MERSGPSALARPLQPVRTCPSALALARPPSPWPVHPGPSGPARPPWPVRPGRWGAGRAAELGIGSAVLFLCFPGDCERENDKCKVKLRAGGVLYCIFLCFSYVGLQIVK